MKWYHVIIIVLSILVGFGLYELVREPISNKSIQSYTYKIDSLKTALKSQEKAYILKIDSFINTIDSLTKVKNKITVKYETIYKDYSNPTIVDDDSITRYISTKIHN